MCLLFLLDAWKKTFITLRLRETVGLQDSFTGLHLNYLSTSRVRDCRNNSFIHPTGAVDLWRVRVAGYSAIAPPILLNFPPPQMISLCENKIIKMDFWRKKISGLLLKCINLLFAGVLSTFRVYIQEFLPVRSPLITMLDLHTLWWRDTR